MVNLDRVLAWLRGLAVVFAEHKRELTDLDAAIGDADHGINMDRGFAAVAAELGAHPPADIGAALKATAMTLIRTVGGAAGPLYGTLFLRMGAACAGRSEVPAAEWAAAFAQGVEAVRQRGKAELGDKTMIDALHPAAAALEQALQQGLRLGEALARAERAASEGMEGTTPMVARKGRASYLGERSAGHQDPGATSSRLLVRAAADILPDTPA